MLPPYCAGGAEVVGLPSLSDEHDMPMTALARMNAIARRCFVVRDFFIIFSWRMRNSSLVLTVGITRRIKASHSYFNDLGSFVQIVVPYLSPYETR
jgi:hypothetical protein